MKDPAARGHARPDPGKTATFVVGDSQPRRPRREFTHLPERYQVLEEIGEGGMGVVLKGWDCRLRRMVAIKVLVDPGNRENAARFCQEARIASKLYHPGIIAVYDFGLDGASRPYMVMPALDGKTLKQVLDEIIRRDREMPRLLHIFLDACQAIAFAHSQGVIHRDLKPANIMTGDFGLVTVMDWGLAKMPGENEVDAPAVKGPAPAGTAAGDSALHTMPKTEAGVTFGTLGYLAPEQARGEMTGVDKRSDVFSLGAILCEILTGKPAIAEPGAKKNLAKTMRADFSAALGRLEACPVPPSLTRLAKSCLAADPDQRPQDAGQAADAISDYLGSGQRRAEQELTRFFELSLDLLCIANLEGVFVRVNDSFPHTLGYSVDELTSRKFIDFVHPEDRAKTLEEMKRLANGQTTTGFRNRYRHARGSYISLEWSAQLVEQEGMIYAIARNVTERKGEKVVG
jgi:eukaryotic-like serine/threonine-protein kinase